jgi:hypothetical protein
MAHQRYFCAAESRANGEELYGTVAQIRSWLLLEHSHAWRRNAVEESGWISPDVKDHIRRLPVDRTLLIRREHHRSGPLQCIFVRSCDDPPSASRHIITDYDDLRGLPSRGEPLNELIFAVCTHGRHDKCCAKFGLPVWSAFRKLDDRRVWQCSHVGGDRFAANVIVLPYGIYYGHVLPEDVPEIRHRSDAGEVWLRGYRGRSCFPRVVQIAEYFVRKESGRLPINEFRPEEILRFAPEHRHVSFRAQTDGSVHTVEFVTQRDALRQRLTCGAMEVSDIAQHKLRSYTVSYD